MLRKTLVISTRNIKLSLRRSNAKSPFIGTTEKTAIDVDRTTNSNQNFNLQRKVIRFSSFKKAIDPENEFDAYESRGSSPLKSKHHYRKYRNWTEHEFDKIVRELPPVVSQHQMEKATGVKSRKHFNTVYMFDKTMLGRVANKIPTFEIKGKNVIEFYPGFGLLSTRILKKEPLSYTFVEPDKRVVQSLGRLAQAAEDNGIGSRIIRAEPLEYDFHKLHFSKARRSMIPDKDSLVSLDADNTDTVVIANVPGWCYKTFTYKMADDLEKRDGIFRAGPVKMYINVVGLVAGTQIGLLDRYSKFIDNYFQLKPVCLVRGQHYRPKIEQHTVWIEFTPRVKPILDLPQEDVRYLLDVMWGTDMFVRHVNRDGSVNTDKFGYIFKDRLSAILDERDPKRAIKLKKAVFVKAGLDPDLKPDNMTHHHLAKVIELMSQYQKRNYEELHAYVDSSQFDIDKANYEQIEEMASRVKSANTMLSTEVIRKRQLAIQAEIERKYDISPGVMKLGSEQKMKTNLSVDPTSYSYSWEAARGSIKQSYKRIEERSNVNRYRHEKKKGRFGNKPTVQKRY